MKNERGFTLIELMVVVAIIAILAALFFSANAESSGVDPEQLSSELASTLDYVRTRALSTRKIHEAEVNFDVSPPEIDVYVAPVTGMAMASFTSSGTVQGVLRIQIPRSLVLWSAVAGAQAAGLPPGQTTSGTYDIFYYPDGSATASTLYVTDRSQHEKYRVLVYHATGSAYARETW